MPAGTIITAALIKIATLLIVHGDAIVYLDGEAIELEGYHVLPASAGHAFVAKKSDTHLTMIFLATREASRRRNGSSPTRRRSS